MSRRTRALAAQMRSSPLTAIAGDIRWALEPGDNRGRSVAVPWLARSARTLRLRALQSAKDEAATKPTPLDADVQSGPHLSEHQPARLPPHAFRRDHGGVSHHAWRRAKAGLADRRPIGLRTRGHVSVQPVRRCGSNPIDSGTPPSRSALHPDTSSALLSRGGRSRDPTKDHRG